MLALRQPPQLLHRCKGEESRGSFQGCRAQHIFPRSDECAAFLETEKVRVRELTGLHLFQRLCSSVFSSVEISPSGKPISRAFNNRLMIFPLLVCGNAVANSISLGATTAPRRTRAKANNSRLSVS